MEEIRFFDILRSVVLCITPVIFLEGIFLIIFKAEDHVRLEHRLARPLGLKKKLVPRLENEVYSFHDWLMRHKGVLGIVFIIYSLMVFVVLRQYSPERIP